ncbi:molecular chaperone GroEL [Erysipelothrix rhusiopathiae]|uniref:chaperonin GroEL n=2 Tax=Erysipelothrix rhusiopathiae TaxID=1648 RepID=UPI00159A972E|nr:chaperonin GroEL [Erysipelothrix rhusiopathiae]QDE04778.1 molecular chaperone GroEL [Erysipelothrix rhusiopathiae]
MAKDVRYGQNSRDLLLKGMDTLANAVSVTLGPKGRNVVLERSFGSPLITNDGVTIAKEIELKNPFENMGAKLLYEVSNKTNDVSGDGTTTATLLAQEMIHKGLVHVDRGANPVLMRLGIEKTSRAIADYLLENSSKIETSSDIANVASISAGSEEIGTIIAEAMKKVGNDGVITVDESNTFETELEVVEGLQYDKGYISPYMVSDRETMEIEMENPYILVTDHKISTIQEILPLLEQIVQQNKPFFIIAEDIDNDVVSTLVVNKLRGTFNVAATKAPGFGDNQKMMLEDIAIATGATFISKELGMNIKETEIDQLGTASKVVIRKDETTLIGGAGTKEAIEERASEIRSQINNVSSDFDKKKLEERLAKLTNGVAVIKVGAATESEMKEKKLRIEDALNATKAAVAEGVVLGGGYALARAYMDLKDNLSSENQDENRGIKTVFESILKPLWQIAENAGFDGDEIVTKQLESELNIGFNAKSGQWENLQESGILDPTRVTRNALLNAASIASLFLTTEAAVASSVEEKQITPEMPPMYYKSKGSP